MSAARPVSPVQPSRFHQLDDNQLADAYGAVDQVAKAAEEDKKALKAEFVRRKLWGSVGFTFIVTRTETPSLRLDTAAIRVEMGEDWCKARSKGSTTMSLRVMPREPVSAEPTA